MMLVLTLYDEARAQRPLDTGRAPQNRIAGGVRPRGVDHHLSPGPVGSRSRVGSGVRAHRPILDDRGAPARSTAGGQDGLRRVGPRRIQKPSRDD